VYKRQLKYILTTRSNNMDSQQSFQDFMLGGRRGNAGPPSPLPGRNTPTPSKKNNNKKTSRQNYGPTLKAFQGRVQEWKDLDDQLYQVLNSIVNLRNRIWWETKSLRKNRKSSSKPWHGSGYRQHYDGYSSCLVTGDIQMAISHDLLQHEKMLSAARMLISSMAQVQDSIGRRLDELYQLLLEDSSVGSSSSSSTTRILHQAQEIYLLLGAELYRKQLLVSTTLESCDDGLLYMDDDTELEADLSKGEPEYSNPRNVAKNCHGNWRLRGDKKKEWNMVENFLAGKTM